MLKICIDWSNILPNKRTMKIVIKNDIKSNLKEINFWDKVDKFDNRIIVEINDGNIYKLEFILGNKHLVNYGSISSIYDLKVEELELIIKKDFKKMSLSNSIYSEKKKVLKALAMNSLEFIPLDECVYIKTDESIEINYEEKIFKTTDIDGELHISIG